MVGALVAVVGSMCFASAAGAWSVSLTPSTQQADVATGYEITMLAGTSERPLTNVDFELPKGVGMSASLGNQLAVCSADQFKIADTEAAPTCPSDSKLADVEMNLPPLGGGPTLAGSAYLGQPQLGTALGDAYPLQIAAQIGSQWAKLEGQVLLNQPGKAEGTASARFPMPGLPLARINFKFRGGDSAALLNPATCGQHDGSVALTDIDGATQNLTTSISITQAFGGGDCNARGFGPEIAFKQSTTEASKNVALGVSISRADGSQHISEMHVEMPSGLAIDPAKTKACPSDQAFAGTCPADFAIGHIATTVGAGAGAITLNGSIFFTLDPKGGPTMVFTIPAKVGPLDLGTVAILAPLTFGTSGKGMAVDSKLPQYFRGIPLVLRNISLTIDAPGMLQNPKDCGGSGLKATFKSTEGATASASAPVTITGGPTCDFIHSVAVAPKKFRPKGARAKRARKAKKVPVGGKLTYTLKTKAAVTQQIQRGTSAKKAAKKAIRAGKCPAGLRWKAVTKVTRTEAAGKHSIKLTGVNKRRRLTAGCYRISMTAKAGGQSSQVHTANFTLVQ